MAKVSIVIPVYNVENYLEECLDSVQHQTLEDIEIICVNDGSTDSSLSILKKYAAEDSRFIIVDKENGGYGKAMNAGFDRATGEYIGIVESDDFVPLNMYEDLYRIAKENELDFVKADFYRFTRNANNGNMNLVYNHLDKSGRWYGKVFNPSTKPDALLFIMNTWSGIYKREFLEKYGIRHNETPGASFQDNGFFFQTFVYAQRAMLVNKPYYMNRRDNPNSSVRSREKVYCANVEYDYIRNILMRDPEIWNRFKYMYSLLKMYNYNFTLTRIDDKFKKEFINRISREFKRAKENGELSRDVFGKKEWIRLMFLMEDPNGFYKQYILKKKLEKKLGKKTTAMVTSATLKAEKAILSLPAKAKEITSELKK